MTRRVLAATLFFAFAAQATEPLEERLQETKSRLVLTEEQLTKVRPILQEHFAAQRAILDQYDIGRGKRPDAQQFRALRRALDASKAQTAKRLAGILSAEQMAEFDKIQAERKKQLYEQFLSKRIEDMGARLVLTEEQLTKVRPILQEHFAAQRAILDQYDIGRGKRPDAQQFRALRRALDASKAQTAKRLAGILSAEQMAEFDKIQAEQREQIRENFRSEP